MANDFRRATHIHLCHSSKLPQDAFPSERLMFYLLYVLFIYCYLLLFIVIYCYLLLFIVIYCYLLYRNLRTCSSLSLYRSPSVNTCQHKNMFLYVPFSPHFITVLTNHYHVTISYTRILPVFRRCDALS
jgi:hypothetical protein